MLVETDARRAASSSSASRHILVDEFQDTDPLQAEILLLLAADDPAERDASNARTPSRASSSWSAIRSSPSIASAAPTSRSTRASSGGSSPAAPTLLHLTTSFRSAPAIQERGERGVRAT